MNDSDNPKAELAAALVKGVVSTIPFVGGVLTEVGDLYVNPIEKRKQQWILEVQNAIEEINLRFSILPSTLQDDEAFISFLYSATIIALKNHQTKKIKSLKNILVSSVNPNQLNDDMVFQFLRYVDELSETHFFILENLSKRTYPINKYDSLEKIFDEMNSDIEVSIDRILFRSFLEDLTTRFLIRFGNIDDFPEYDTFKHYIVDKGANLSFEVTSIGKDFISFIQASNS